MGIFIKNPETERVVRELAAARGDTITGVIDKIAREALEREQTAATAPTASRFTRRATAPCACSAP